MQILHTAIDRIPRTLASTRRVRQANTSKPHAMQISMGSVQPVSPSNRQRISFLFDELRDGDFSERWSIAKQLAKWGDDVIDGAIALLQKHDNDDELCWFMAQILGNSPSPAAVSALLDLLTHHADKDVKAKAATTLAHLGSVAIAPLARLLEEPQWRLLAVRALAEVQHPDVVDVLLPYSSDTDATVRAEILATFSIFRTSRVLSSLIRGLEDPASIVRREATVGLGLQRDFAEERELVRLLKRQLFDLDLGVCQQAAIALSRLGTVEAVTVLSQTLQSSLTPQPLRLHIVRSISWIETPAALEALRDGLSIDDPDVCGEILDNLGRIQNPQLEAQILQILTQWLDSGHPALKQPRVRRSIALGLKRLGSPAISHFENDPDETVRYHAATEC
ncbi:MAG: HEAT repeat domain-containing protein [Cyanobacteria bacterium SID2]|nr:HEAT repeat domain-containing protein [Cyanobacteria bacterium SID2]MBP0005405.1 HEAT repeat domain-containing protein [Cyanobacteria bacterium SBC]